ncbi:MAG TPA: PP2C family protein-serine/threonine phosphatase [Vicinamibacteria bacterium]|jgi:serine phosphatase RsbU (regulator of sigma subunit)|nr:PP2C family protein-serine/threonine phosphatase [Vicinamibacteria bacterium]
MTIPPSPTGQHERAGAAVSEPRPRALIVGDSTAWPGTKALAETLNLRSVNAEEALSLLATDPPDVVFVDGYLPAATLNPILEAAGQPGRAGRPAVMVMADEGRRTNVEDRLLDHADDFVNTRRGEEALFARLRIALRVRGCLVELSRKNAELASLYAQLETLAGRMAGELRLASQVQRSLLPPPLHHPRLDVAGEFIPMREIGGDYYDLVPLGPDRLALAIGDVMGKGVPAALLAANLKACLRAHLQGDGHTPEELIGRVNRLFWDVTPRGLFASLFFAIFDFQRGALDYVNAGHDHPFVVRPGGAVEDLGVGGTVLGLMEGSRYDRGRAAISGDDLLVFFSDGVTDRANRQGEMYGVERLKDAAVRCRADAARISLYTLLGEVQGWSSGIPAEDDMTLIVGKLRQGV